MLFSEKLCYSEKVSFLKIELPILLHCSLELDIKNTTL